MKKEKTEDAEPKVTKNEESSNEIKEHSQQKSEKFHLKICQKKIKLLMKKKILKKLR